MAQTQEQAQAQADAANLLLTSQDPSITDRLYKVIDLFTPGKDSDWSYVLIPDKWKVQYDAATLQQQYSFYRVSNDTQAPPIPADYVAQFDINAAADPVLGPYLGL